MPGDLVGGRYPLVYPYSKSVGQPGNATQSNLAVRSNTEIAFLGNLTDAAAALVSGKMTVVAVPVEVGDVITKVSVLVGATAASTPTHSWAAVYSGTTDITKAALQAQSADGTTTAIAASGRVDFTLASAVTVTPALAPNGFLWVAVSVTASAVPSLVSAAIAAACQYAWFTNTPTPFAETVGSALGATAPAAIGSTSAAVLATPPAVFLS